MTFIALFLTACASAGDDDSASSADSGTPVVDSTAPDDSDTTDSTPHTGDSDTGEKCTKLTWYADLDADGFGDASASTLACEAPAGFVADATDCDDAHATVHPGAGERSTDGRDGDCDGVLAVTNIADVPRWETTGPAAFSKIGTSVVTGDFDGDGIAEFAATTALELGDGYHSGALLFEGPLAPAAAFVDTTTANAQLYGETVGSANACAPGDLDRDGFVDLILGFTNADAAGGMARIVRGPIQGSVDLTEDVQTFSGDWSISGHLGVCAGPGDLDGDGAADLVLTEDLYSDSVLLAGSAYVLLGPVEHTSLADAEQVLRGNVEYESLGFDVARLGDMDGDGAPDFSISNRQESMRPLEAGIEAHVVTDHVTMGVVHPRDLGTTIGWDVAYEGALLASEVGDVNGDGYDDLALGGSETTIASTMYIFEGPVVVANLSLVDDASLTVSSTSDGPHWLAYAEPLGDWNADGGSVLAVADPNFTRAETLVGHDCAYYSGCNEGAVFLLTLPLEGGALDLDDTADRIEAAYHAGNMGGNVEDRAIDGRSDLDGDGVRDLVLGTWSAGTNFGDDGVVSVIFGGGTP